MLCARSLLLHLLSLSPSLPALLTVSQTGPSKTSSGCLRLIKDVLSPLLQWGCLSCAFLSMSRHEAWIEKRSSLRAREQSSSLLSFATHALEPTTLAVPAEILTFYVQTPTRAELGKLKRAEMAVKHGALCSCLPLQRRRVCGHAGLSNHATCAQCHASRVRLGDRRFAPSSCVLDPWTVWPFCSSPVWLFVSAISVLLTPRPPFSGSILYSSSRVRFCGLSVSCLIRW